MERTSDVASAAEPPNISFVVENQPENVSLVREMLGGVAEFLRLDAEALDDIKTAVSEACNNVVLHAYDGGPGPLRVEMTVLDGGVEVVVCDQGTGIRPKPRPQEHMQGIGLSVIQALTDRVEFRSPAGGEGTAVSMRFGVPAVSRLARAPAAGHAPSPETVAAMQDGVLAAITVAPGELGGPVLSRLVAAFAARAKFSIDRLSDAQLLADSVAAHAAQWLTNGCLRVGINAGDRQLELRVGPLRSGQGEQVVEASAVGGLAPLLRKLSDEITIVPADGADVLSLRMNDSR